MHDGRRSIETVLLVDDSEPVLTGWSRELGFLGKRVMTAKRRSDVDDVLNDEMPDLALVDLYLEGESGLDIVRDLKAVDPGPFVIVVTGAPSVAFTMEAVRAGADDVFAKPVQAAHMIRVAEGRATTEPTPDEEALTLDHVEWEHICQVLLDCNGNVSAAARVLGIYRQTLQRKIRKHVPR